MLKNTLKSLAMGVLGASIFLFDCDPVFSAQAILSNMRGKVFVQGVGSSLWKQAQDKMLINEGEKIRTEDRSRAILLFQDGSRTTVYPKTTITLSALAAPVALEQSSGRSRHKVKQLGRGFRLRTPTAVCSVRGTEFGVEIGETGNTRMDVYEGVVNGLKLATGESIDVPAGQSLDFNQSQEPLPAPQPIEGTQESSAKQQLRREVSLDMTREALQQAAAEEMKLAEYQEGKTLIDVHGNRVRLQEYILRKPKEVPEADRDKAFKFVVLNWRENRTDYFTYKGIFNKALPDDLSLALKNVTGRTLGDQPEYYLRSYEMTQSNLTDAIKDMADGGHLVAVTFDGTQYTLKAHSVASDGSAGAVTDTLTQNASANGGIYDPVADAYIATTANPDGVYDPVTDTFVNMQAGQTLWRTVFNRYGHLMGSAATLAGLTLNDVPSTALLATTDGSYSALTGPWFQYYQAASGITNIASLASQNNVGVTSTGKMATTRGVTLDIYPDHDVEHVRYRYLNGNFATDSYFPDSANINSPTFAEPLYKRILIYYPKSAASVAYEQYDTYIFNDEGKKAPISAFQNVTSGKDFKQQLLLWNYEQDTKSSAFSANGDIQLVAEPKILIRSGLIK